MRYLLFFGIFACFHLTIAQTHSKGFSVGMSLARAERPGYSYYKPVKGLAFDGFYQYGKGHFISRTSLGFQQKGFSQELIFVDSNDNVLGQGAKENTKFSYLSLSELAGLQFGEKLFGYAAIGLSAYYYIATNVRSDDFTLDNGMISKGYNLTFNNLKAPDLSCTFEGGVGAQLKSGLKVMLIANYNQGILKIRYKDTETANPWYNNHFSFRLGFMSLI